MTERNAQLLSILPARLRSIGTEQLQEIRLRLGRVPRLVTAQGHRDLEGEVTQGELSFVINSASRYSPWNSASLKEGYLTAPGGHRIGVCGDAQGEEIRTVSSVCIRVARDIREIAAGLPTQQPLLILGPPGSGKTTLLRDLIRRIPQHDSVSVVDERREIFPEGFPVPANVDVLQGISKSRGIDMVLRSMGPQVIAMDEITSQNDCNALLRAAWCGVRLIATAHASSVRDLWERSVYRPLAEMGLFSKAVILDRDKHWCLKEVET